MSLAFIITALLVCLAPGIGVVYTLSVTLAQGLRAGIWAAFGCSAATLVHLGVAMAGLAAALHSSALVFQAIKYAGVAYLLWMAWGAARGTGGLSFSAKEAPATSTPRLIWRGVMLNLLNPKLPMFFMAFLPQFMAPTDGTLVMAQLGAAFAAMTFGTFVFYALLAASGRTALLGSERAMTWLRRAFAASFAALGFKLALQDA